MSIIKFPAKGKSAPSGYKVVAKGDTAEIYIYGAIGGDWFGEGVTAKQVADDLKALGKVKNIDVRINSEGGSVFEGKAIYSLLTQHGARITAKIDGLAASAASFIAMAAHEIEISEGAFVMIHNAYGVCVGGAHDMRSYAQLLDTVNETIREVYAARTKQDTKSITKWMDDETWFTGKEAVANGFADKLVENLKVAASISDPSRFKHLPAALKPRRAAAIAQFAKFKK
jgi:ATP-dependent protease ClpP protease subunit